MTIDIKTIEAFDRWWNTKPEPHIPAPRQCHMKMQQDRMLAIWVSAWDAATNNKNPVVELTDAEINEVADEFWKEDTFFYGYIDYAKAVLKKASEK